MAPLARRHPSLTIVVVVTMFVLILFYANSGSSSTSFPLHSSKFRARPPSALSVTDHMKLYEAYYDENLKDRENLIKKLGPTREKVQAFPTDQRLYTLWDFFIPAFACPHRVQRVGTLGDGGKWVCGLGRIAEKPSCVVYSIGVNDESSFEADLLKRAPGCQVWGYDFTTKGFGPELSQMGVADRGHFKPYRLGGKDAHGPNDEPKTYTLSSLMEQNGHTFIDILKIDIEGAEFETLISLVAAFPARLPFGQMQLEIHAREPPYDTFAGFLGWWEMLEKAGLRPFWTEPNLVYLNLVKGALPNLVEYSFINTKGKHTIITDITAD